MKHQPTLAAFLLASSGALLHAQVSIPVNVMATYLRTNGDASVLPAPGIPLSAVGTGAGQWVRIETTGAYNGGGTGDVQQALFCLFSSSGTLLPDGTTNRVPGALAAGPQAVSPRTYQGNIATDIPQDFIVASNGYENGVLVHVPAGATHVFCSIPDNYFTNNADPNNDFAVVFTPATPPSMTGTNEHAGLRTGVNGTPTASPDVKTAAAFSTVGIEVRTRFGVSTGMPYLLMADLYQTSGSPPVAPFPGLFVGANAVLIQIGAVTTTPAQASIFIPPGHAGLTLILQAGYLGDARNGLFQSSDPHRIQLQ